MSNLDKIKELISRVVNVPEKVQEMLDFYYGIELRGQYGRIGQVGGSSSTPSYKPGKATKARAADVAKQFKLHPRRYEILRHAANRIYNAYKANVGNGVIALPDLIKLTHYASDPRFMDELVEKGFMFKYVDEKGGVFYTDAQWAQQVGKGVEVGKEGDVWKPVLTEAEKSAGWQMDTLGRKYILSEKSVNKGVFEKYRVTIQGNGDALIKTNNTHREGAMWGDEMIKIGFAQREVVAYEVDKALGLGIVPRVIPLIKDGEYFSMQDWTEDAQEGIDFNREKIRFTDPDDVGKVMLLDAINNSDDRHGHNWLVQKKRGVTKIVAIDNGLGWIEYSSKPYFDRRNQFGSYDTQDGRFILSKGYQINLNKAISDGSLLKSMQGLKGFGANNDGADRLIADSMKRAVELNNNWDKYFVEAP